MPATQHTGPPAPDAARGHCPLSIGLLLTAKGCHRSVKGKFTFPWKAQQPRERSDTSVGLLSGCSLLKHTCGPILISHISACVSGWIRMLCSWTLSNGSGLQQTPRRSSLDGLHSALNFQFGKGNCIFISSNEGRVKGVATKFFSLPTCASHEGEVLTVFL